MATGKKAKSKKHKAQDDMMVMPMVMEDKKEEKAATNEWGGEPLDPQEEKMLDWILKAIVIFVLGWLALGVILSIKGLIWPS